MKLLLIDFETTGIDPKTARPVEVGAMVWDTETGQERCEAWVLWDESFGEIPLEASHIHGITTERARTEGLSPREGIARLLGTLSWADYVVAHNAHEYDRVILEEECKRWGIELPQIRWIDTRNDLPYSPRMNCRKLSHLALDHGIVVDPEALHGAEGDTLLMQKLLKCYLQSLPEVARISQAPILAVFAQVSYEGRELARKEGFRWSPDTLRPDTGKKGAWVKRIRDFQLGEEKTKAATAGFKIQVLSE